MKSGKVVGKLTPEAAVQLDLNTSVKVINGGHDQYCAAIGTGSVNDGELFLSAGTAWVLMGIFKEPVFNNKTYIARDVILLTACGSFGFSTDWRISMEWFKIILVPV